MIDVGPRHHRLCRPAHGVLLLGIEDLALIRQFGGGDFVGGEELAGLQGEHIETARDFRAVDAPPIPVGRPVPAEHQRVLVDRPAVEVGDLKGSRRVREIDDRQSALVPGLHENIAAGNRQHRAVVRHAVLLLDLRRGNLEVAAKFEPPVHDVVDGVGAPVHRIVASTARPAAAAPLIGEQHLVAVVVKRGGVPVGEAAVADVIDAHGIQRIADVENNAVARAGAGRDLPRGKHGDVVTLIGRPGVLSVLAVVAAAPQAGDLSGFGVRKHGGAVHDTRAAGVLERNFDHVDAKQRGALVAGGLVETTRQLVCIAHRGGSGVVHHDAFIVGVHH